MTENVNEALKLIAKSIEMLKVIFDECEQYDVYGAQDAISLLNTAVDKLSKS
jgi:hypothetical protein